MRSRIGHASRTVAVIAVLMPPLGIARAQAAAPDPTGRIYTAAEVDSHATHADGVRPRYPVGATLQHGDVRITAQFIVERTGIVDTASAMFEDNAPAPFVASVREALPAMRYTPARKNGMNVAEEITETFAFGVANTEAPANDSATAASPPAITPARTAPGSVNPLYPYAPRKVGFSGAVDAEFVIDSTGHADMMTFKVRGVRAWKERPTAYVGTDPTRHIGEVPVLEDDAVKAFVKAVADALPRMQFIPGKVDGRDVPMLVVKRFMFDINSPAQQ
ncbi:MAG: hypothetical protein M3Z30_09380 [Gemmatimonadota bacterium]|nr:hypothetical protein [Gemmatimonadota bacterium]